jgi:hypothetical protein
MMKINTPQFQQRKSFVMSRVMWVAIDGVCIGDSICWQLLHTTRNYKKLLQPYWFTHSKDHCNDSTHEVLYVFTSCFLVTATDNILCLRPYWLTNIPQLTNLKVKVTLHGPSIKHLFAVAVSIVAYVANGVDRPENTFFQPVHWPTGRHLATAVVSLFVSRSSSNGIIWQCSPSCEAYPTWSIFLTHLWRLEADSVPASSTPELFGSLFFTLWMGQPSTAVITQRNNGHLDNSLFQGKRVSPARVLVNPQ